MSAGGERALPGEPFGVPVDPRRWKKVLPRDVWPDGFPEAGYVWRRDVVAVADAWRVGDASSRQLAAAALMWGYGRVGYGPWRTRKVLDADPAGTRLDSALTGLRAERPCEGDLETAYRSFRDRNVARLPWLGPAFFTKILYFAGYRRGSGGVQPLILDRVVARRLPDGAGAGRRSGGWGPHEWLDYLRWSADRAARDGVEPEQVEMALFSGTYRGEGTGQV